MTGLRMYLLGSPRLVLDGKIVHFDTRKNIALLAYLAITGASHSREALVTLLWPELEPGRARAGLRRNLSVLKKVLGEEWLAIDRYSIGLKARSNFYLDVDHFHSLPQGWQRHGHGKSQMCPDCFSLYEEAVELYQGDFLAGFSLRDTPHFDEWQFFLTEEYRQELAEILGRLVAGLTQQGAFERAIPFARRNLSLDPLQEESHRILMHLYARTGQLAAAFRQYNECERILEEELDLTPEAETKRLFMEIKSRRGMRNLRKYQVSFDREEILNSRYRLDSELGRGSMGVVFRGYDLLLDREVAVKVYSGATMGRQDRARLLREAKIAARLNHPNIISLFDAGEGKDTSYIVSELMIGHALNRQRPKNLADILYIARQVCSALEHAHGLDIVHRDLKPENIMMTIDGIVKITDFGLAQSVASRVTDRTAIIGTLNYMAPELVAEENFDGRADLYSLGVILYELTTGHLPFPAKTPIDVISQRLRSKVVPPRVRNPEMPTKLESIILSLLKKDPEDRPASASEVRHSLETIEGSEDASF